MAMTGAQVMIECLKREGVEVIFGYPGGAVLPIYDALYDAPLRHVMARHEQAAAHAADGYARATGRVGVCLATSGPGATNLVTGIATAYMDSSPVVFLTGQVPTHMMGRDSFQEADVLGITMPVTKHNEVVRSLDDLPRVVHEAFRVATSGRPGPVLVDLPKDITSQAGEYREPQTYSLGYYKANGNGHDAVQEMAEGIRKAAGLLAGARRPVLFVGGGVIAAAASEDLIALAEAAMLPVATTLMGLGAFPADHPLFLGMVGMHGTYAANQSFCQADLLLAVGVRFDDRATGRPDRFAPNARIVHIDIDSAEIGKIVPADLGIVGDAGAVLRALRQQISGPGDVADWHKLLGDWKREYPLTYPAPDGRIMPQQVIEEVDRVTAGNAIVVTDVGQHQMWAAHYYRYRRPRSFLTSGGLGTMGFGLPAAIGAQVGRPGEQVFLISGDGSFLMTSYELATAVEYGLPVKIALMNNGYLGMVRQWQEMFYSRRYSSVHLSPSNPDFARLAESFGAVGMRVTRPAEIRPAVEEAMEIQGPVVIEFQVEPEINVYPMVPAGAGLDETIAGL